VRRHWPLLVDAGLVVTVVVLFALSGTVISVPLAVAQLAPLIVRRRAPGVALVVIGAATAAHSLLGMARAVGYLPLALALYTAATQPSRRLRWWLCGGVAVVAATAGAIRHGPVEGGLLAGVAFVVTWLAGVERGEHLRDRTAHAAEGARLLSERRQADRQERLARRLHDSLAHTMTVMLVQTEALRSTADLAGPERDRLDAVLRAGRTALSEVRTALADQEDQDAHTLLADRLAAARAAGLEILPPPGDLPVLLARLLGEAAVNALRHDGPGTRLEVWYRPGELRLTSVPPRHRRSAAAPGGFGLRTLRTEIERAGGRLRYGPDQAGRWQVVAMLPSG